MMTTSQGGDTFIERLAMAAGLQTGDITELAQFCNISYGTMKNYVYNNKRLPSPDVLIAIYNETNLSITWLLTGDGSMYSDNTGDAVSDALPYKAVSRSERQGEMEIEISIPRLRLRIPIIQADQNSQN